MYHYVREYDGKLPFFRFLSITNFKKQLEYFKEKYDFISIEDFNKVIDAKIPPPKNKIVLTFDDGLICHYKYVYPVLKEMGLWGIFYIPTMYLSENKILPVHLIHILCGSVKPDILLNQLNMMIKDFMITDKKIKSFREETYNNQKNLPEVYLFKRILNFYIDYKFRDKILNDLMNINNLKYNVNDVYLSKNQLIEMSDDMVIGSHSHSHPVFSKLSYNEQKNDISKSFYELEKRIKKFKMKTFCFPYGGDHVFNKDTLQILSQENCKFSFNVESRDILDSDIKKNILKLPRFDCNEFKFGKVEPLKL